MLIIGHRGARAREPENTVRGVREGLKCADFAEVDVRLSADGVPVLMHDATVERTTGEAGHVRALTFRELRTLDAGRGERVPALETVLAVAASYPGKGLCIEIKEPCAVAAVAAALHRIRPDRVLVTSFHPNALMGIRRLLPGIPIGIIAKKGYREAVATAVEVGASSLFYLAGEDDAAAAAAAGEAGLELFFWTMNDPAGWERAAALGAAGVVTDDPCRAHAWQAERRRPDE
ncbi:MAG TPA: glycerophosphodiester phosphodiesterase [Methanoculleus sp.]|nr:glycerophosphodiester phosphodiesterase [Methanoculleus sp.]